MAMILHPLSLLSSSSSSSSSSCFSTTTNNKLHLLLHTAPQHPKFSSIRSEQQEEKPAGFGAAATKKASKGKRDSILRRQPFEKPSFASSQPQQQELNETAFLLAWSALGLIILLQGIALAASGFLPEAWDKLFVKYLYPSFTPTVFLFVAGTTAYGVLKYLQNDNSNTKN